MKEHLPGIAIDLLQQLISIPSFSKEETKTASLIEDFLAYHNIITVRKGNNVWSKNRFYDPTKPTILLNSHHDTVKPNPAYTRNPFSANIEGGKLFGLGSNDAGGALVSLLVTYFYFYGEKNLKHNLILLASAEEEISGTGGVELVWNDLPKIDCAIVGEPTLMEMAIAEKGLLVLDCIAKGKAGHAAREEGVNAIYEALDDITWFESFQFPRISKTLGKVKMTVTMINAGQAHNQVPPECKFTVDCRVTDAYSFEEILEEVKRNVKCEIVPRSLRLRPSSIEETHPLALAGKKLGLNFYGSPTTSDQALIPVPSVKIGPGDSARSHSADEFIYTSEIEKGIDTYIDLLEGVIK